MKGQLPLWGDGHAARDAGCLAVTEHEKVLWRALHDYELRLFLTKRGNKPFLAEDFRRQFLARGNPHPHHPNVWGAMWLHCVNEGWVEKTGRFRPMVCHSSHGRLTAEWRKAA